MRQPGLHPNYMKQREGTLSETAFLQNGLNKSPGLATGTIKLDANGRTPRNDWSNGVVFKRN